MVIAKSKQDFNANLILNQEGRGLFDLSCELSPGPRGKVLKGQWQ